MNPLVLLPGMNCSEDLWTGCGLGGSLTPPLDRSSVDEQVDVLLAELPSRFALVGLSLGAVVALELVLRAPDRVSALVVTSVNGREPTDAQRRSWAGWRSRLRSGVTARDLQAEIVTSLLTPDDVASRPDLVARTLAMSRDEEVLDHQLAMQDSRADLLGRLPALRVPTLVVSGKHDAICPPAFHATITEAVPGARLVASPAGHLVPLQDPEGFGDLVRSWCRP